MRYVILFGLLFSIFIRTESKDILPMENGEKKHAPVPLIRYRTISALSLVGAPIGPVCRFKFKDSYFGYLSNQNYALSRKSVINFTCYPADSGVVTQGWTTYDPSDKKWHISLSPRDAKMYTNAHATYQLTSVNALGWAVTINDVTGDERYRQRHLHYCLIRGSKALCGNGDMGYLQDGKKKDLTPYTLQILRSIEFIDDAPAQEPAPASVQDTITAPP